MKDKTNILSVLKTKSDANVFVDVLKSVSDDTHSLREINLEKIISDKIKLYDSTLGWEKYVSSLLESIISSGDMKKIRKELNSLEDNIRNAEIIRVEIPFKPTDKFVDDIYGILNRPEFLNTFEDNLLNNFLIDFEINKSLRGGIKIFVAGKYINLTYRSYLGKYLMSKDVIRRYL